MIFTSLLAYLLAFYLYVLAVTNEDTIPETTLDTLVILRDVEVEAKYLDLHEDGTLDVRVHGNPLADGHLMENFLMYVPGVIVKDDAIGVVGSESTVFEMDGRIISRDELKNIPLKMVSRLEVVRHGGIKYGMGDVSVLRVVMRRIPGLLGTLHYAHALDEYGTYKIEPNNTLLLREGRHSLYNNLTYTHYDTQSKQQRWDHYEDGTQDVRLQSRTKRNRLTDNLSYQYDLSDNDRLMLKSSVSFSHTDKHNGSTGADNLYTLVKERYKSFQTGLNYNHSFGNLSDGRRHEWETEVSYSNSDIESDDDYQSSAWSHAESHEDRHNVGFRSYARFALSGKQNLSLCLSIYGGPKHYRYTGITDATLSSIRQQDYTETVLGRSLSASYSATWHKLYVCASLSYDYAPTKHTDRLHADENFTRTSGGLISMLNLRWNIDIEQGRVLDVSYNNGYSIPNFYYFTPAVTYSSPTMYKTGNMHLKDENYHRLSMNFAFNNHLSINARINYSHNLVDIILHESKDNPDVHFTRPENIGHSFKYELTFNHSNFVIPKVWYMSNMLQVFYTYQRMDTQRFYAPSTFFMSSNMWMITPTFRLTLTAGATPRTKLLNGECEGCVLLNPGASLSLMKGNLNINLQGANILRKRQKMTYWGDGFSFTRRDITHPDYLTLTLTWNFHAGRKIQQTRLTEVNASGTGLTIPGI